jgi:hypothetical protein
MTGTVVTWLTQEAHDRLQHELGDGYQVTYHHF